MKFILSHSPSCAITKIRRDGNGFWNCYGHHYQLCIHAVAYSRLHRNLLLQQILDDHVDKHHTYEYEAQLLQNNILPVCMQRISPDGITLPPRRSRKRSTGRPKKLRIRKRSRWAHEPEKSNIKCSKCHERGNNVRTCSARQALATQELDLS